VVLKPTPDTLCGELAPLLAAELAAGNEIKETGFALGSSGTLVLLKRPCQAPPDTLPPAVDLVSVNDPHWWKSEYRCTIHPHVIAFPFEG
jgi:hypothetical protein